MSYKKKYRYLMLWNFQSHKEEGGIWVVHSNKGDKWQRYFFQSSKCGGAWLGLLAVVITSEAIYLNFQTISHSCTKVTLLFYARGLAFDCKKISRCAIWSNKISLNFLLILNSDLNFRVVWYRIFTNVC